MTGSIGTALADEQDPSTPNTFMPRKPPLAQTKPKSLSSHGAGQKRLVIAQGENSANTSLAQEKAMQRRKKGECVSAVERRKLQEQEAKVEEALKKALDIPVSPLVE